MEVRIKQLKILEEQTSTLGGWHTHISLAALGWTPYHDCTYMLTCTLPAIVKSISPQQRPELTLCILACTSGRWFQMPKIGQLEGALSEQTKSMVPMSSGSPLRVPSLLRRPLVRKKKSQVVLRLRIHKEPSWILPTFRLRMLSRS